MRYLVISDVHSNYVALERVLEESPEYDKVINLGDMLGLMGYPSETLDFMMEKVEHNLMGNHDFAIIVKDEGHVNSEELSKFELEYTKDRLSEEQVNFVKSLDSMEVMDDMVMCHAMPHPAYATGYKPGNLGIEKKDYTEEAPYIKKDFGEGTIVLHGHTHEQGFLDTSKFGHDVKFLNPGSVGQPMGKAEYAIIDTETEETSLKSVSYDERIIKERLKELDIPVRFWTKTTTRQLGYSF